MKSGKQYKNFQQKKIKKKRKKTTTLKKNQTNFRAEEYSD